ncbi:hypothetical protein J4G43_005015 [Bradyrhizobium barranii subsp. barranii]|uniref:Uncharacterized protein n=1 Tax=Bradyrhizobium barranii subsp. barranii TaxID=2823807 RepID=A0A939S0Q3_9BRAD|nr:hypothetical protein [Bradyrhizobium barranii]UEM13684.1 hypothetical protein J4G43_005015 [Bradyrhizobium barranii subsp. barranii]
MSEQRLLLAHQIAERTLNARVQVLTFNEPDGAKRFAVGYSNAVHKWLSAYRFETDLQADAAAMVLREWLLGGHNGRR